MKNIKYVTVAEPLFLGGKNHQLKIFNGGGITIEHDEEKDHVKITYKDEVATIKHYTSIVEGLGQVLKKTAPQAQRGPIRAQVSTPQDHVFSEGPGKTRD